MPEYDFKSEHVKRVRAIIDSVGLQLPLPKVNPSPVSAPSVVTSLAFVLVLKHSPVLALLLVVVTLLLDWFDGLIAKKYELCSREGYLVDLVADRAYEAILFIPYFALCFYLFILNGVLTLFGIAKHKHILLPLRAVFIVAFVFLELV
jgi:phosphatidylserine synthase